MFDLDAELNRFYQDHVRLGKARADELARFRDARLTGLRTGLDKLGTKRNRTYAHYQEFRNQGGYAMKTLNQARDNEYDIDVGLIFRKKDLPESPKGARERVRDAFIETSGQFREPPEARKNAVTLWYAGGQHLDFAVYRRWQDTWGRTFVEHASGDEWRTRDPDQMTSWFAQQVEDASPKRSFGALVEDGQLRRIVRLVKFFARSRAAWRMPGGMILTTLVANCYRPNATRDDIALVDTLAALAVRLQFHTTVPSPVDASNLVEAPKRQAEILAFKRELATAVGAMRVLSRWDCTREQARNAWRQFFNHDFWTAANDSAVKSLLGLPTAAPAGGSLSFPDHKRAPTRPQEFG